MVLCLKQVKYMSSETNRWKSSGHTSLLGEFVFLVFSALNTLHLEVLFPRGEMPLLRDTAKVSLNLSYC